MWVPLRFLCARPSVKQYSIDLVRQDSHVPNVPWGFPKLFQGCLHDSSQDLCLALRAFVGHDRPAGWLCYESRFGASSAELRFAVPHFRPPLLHNTSLIQHVIHVPNIS